MKKKKNQYVIIKRMYLNIAVLPTLSKKLNEKKNTD